MSRMLRRSVAHPGVVSACVVLFACGCRTGDRSGSEGARRSRDLEGGRVVVIVRGAGMADGTSVRVGLVQDRTAWPDGPYPHGGLGAFHDDRAEVVIEGVAEGRWGMVGFVDVDGDAELDRNAWGLPLEPLIFGNGARPRFGPPSLEACMVEVRGDSTEIDATLIQN